MRVTNKMLVVNSLANLNRSLDRLDNLNRHLAAGKKLLLPSDDPIGTANVMHLDRSLAETKQYLSNVDYAVGLLNATDSALGEMGDVLQRARELSVYGASDTLPQESRQALAEEVDQLLHHAIQVANSTYAGNYLFAGQKTATMPFASVGSPVTAVNYLGDSGSIDIEVGPGVTLAVNVPGDVVFATAFQQLIDLRDKLSSGDTASISQNCIGGIDAAINQILTFRAEVGAKVKRLEITRHRLEDLDINLQNLISQEEDVDVAQAIMELKMQENSYRLALDSTARIIQPTLMDFLR